MVSSPFNTKVRRIHDRLYAAGATDIFFVGGYVRDLVLGIPSKDVDLEIYGLSYDQIATALRPLFHIGQVGQSFSVIKVDNEIDLAIPRREKKVGVGHCAFEVVPDSSMTFAEAASRRDFTINAIGMRLDGTFCDPFNGLEDLKRGVLRAPTERFCEDPLRVLRGVQFAARFGFNMEPRTVEFCRSVLSEFGTLSAERIYGELEKWAIKGIYPEKGLEVLCATGWIACFPELNQLDRDNWAKTCSTCEAVAKLSKVSELPDAERLLVMFAALLHKVGASGAMNMLKRWRAPIAVMKGVKALIEVHDYHVNHAPSLENVRRLSVALTPANIRLWRLLTSAENAEESALLRFHDWVDVAQMLGVLECQPEPILHGRDLEKLGIEPGREMGVILRRAWDAQLAGVFTSHDTGMAWLREFISEKKL